MEKILSYYQDAKKLIKKELVVPRMVSIWLSNTCNLNCEYCHYSQLHGDGVLIDIDKTNKLLDELAKLGIEGIEFSGGGEPSLHTECFKFAERANKLGIKVGLLTNGAAIDLDRVHHFKYIRVGLDALDNKMYSKIKGCPERVYSIVVDNIKKLVKNKKDKQLKQNIGIKFMLDNTNYDLIKQMVMFGRELEVDYVTFRKVCGSFEMNNELADEIGKYIEQLKDEHFNFIRGSFMFEELREKCFMAPIHAVITAKGDLLNCCYFNEPQYVIGNVFEKNFYDVWFSVNHTVVQDKINVSDCNKLTCRWRKYNNYMRETLSGNSEIEFN